MNLQAWDADATTILNECSIGYSRHVFLVNSLWKFGDPEKLINLMMC